MTFDLVVTMTANLIENTTGLKVKVVPEHENRVRLHCYAKGAFLGYTTVAKHMDGKIHLGGVNSGCFIHLASENDLSEIMAPHFRALELQVNK